MKIEVVKNTGNTKDPYTYTIFVDDEVKYDNLTYDEVMAITIGELDKFQDKLDI